MLFLIKETRKKLELEKFSYDITGLIYKTRNKKVKEINIISPDIITGLIKYNFNRKYKHILKLIIETDETGDEGNLMLALNELSRLKMVMNKKYNKQLKKRDADFIHKKIILAENSIKEKILTCFERKNNILEKEQVNHKGR